MTKSRSKPRSRPTVDSDDYDVVILSGNEVQDNTAGSEESDEPEEDELDEDDSSNDDRTSSTLSPYRALSVPLPDDPTQATPELMAALDKAIPATTSTSKPKTKVAKPSKSKASKSALKVSKSAPEKASKFASKALLPAVSKPIKCFVKLFEADQFSKSYKSRTSSQIRNFAIDRSDEWDAVKLEMLKIIDNCWSPPQLDLNDYEITYAIPRKVSDPVPLVSEHDLSSLLAITDPTKDITANVSICAKKLATRSEKENNESLQEKNLKRKTSNKSDSDEEAWMFEKNAKKKKGKEKQKPEPKINLDLSKQVELLRAKWECSEPDGSDYCFWTEQDREHKPISSSMFRTWGEALLKGDPDIADINHPPNHEKFSSLHTGKKMAISPLLERRRRDMNRQENSAGPSIHVHLPDYLSERTTIPAHAAPLSAVAPIPPPPLSINSESTKLIQGAIGPDMPIETFGSSYDLTETVTSRLKTNGYMKAKTLRHVTIDELTSMGFKPGEIASLRDAVEDWAA
ncbi:hypothetical protein D9757_007979 [Collybiopsis confluens]|uniref:Uncharacterized protein n=1 Tax=Collybiopsis confluens TaxID=2823264 RepID=A0A8H5M4E3_9AGAR|nr:hypothetical protein D9757_007979 [Collybiopsis confluens]